MKMGVLGPRGTHTEIAAMKLEGKAEFIRYPNITDVVKAVASGEVDEGVIPIESLKEGSVGEALDALAWMDVKVKAEIVLPIYHSLLGVKGATLKDITQVLSHPQALAQCRDSIQTHLSHAELIEMTSTAKAAEQVGKLQQRHMAAIGAKALADLYGLEVLMENIQTGEANLTRFFRLAKEDSPPTGDDKTSIVFYTSQDRPGILHEILGEFATRRINLTKIESRPSKKALGEYLFFIDFNGHRTDSKIQETLEGVKKKTAMMKIIGSYPRRF